MTLKYIDSKGDEQTLEINSIDFLHKVGTALVVDSNAKAYEIEFKRILRVAS